MKVMFCGGGTAGHIYPAIAMAEIIKSKYKDAEFLFIGRERGGENRAISSSGYALRELKLRGLKRSASPANILAMLEALRATEQAAQMIEEFCPDVIIGTGGYVTWPVIRAGIRMKIPTAIHESNAIPGLVTKLLARGCDAVMLGMRSATLHLSKCNNLHYVGNPVRKDFKRIDRASARRKLGVRDDDFLIVSFGGSLGAAKMNSVITEFMRGKLGEGKIRHLHATGRRHYDEICASMPELVGNSRIRIVPYIDNVPLWFSAADLAITRSGAITLAEIIRCALPAILIPSPNVAGDHQRKNALNISDIGGAILIEEDDLSADVLAQKIEMLISSENTRLTMKKKLSELGDTDCASRVISVIECICERRT